MNKFPLAFRICFFTSVSAMTLALLYIMTCAMIGAGPIQPFLALITICVLGLIGMSVTGFIHFQR